MRPTVWLALLGVVAALSISEAGGHGTEEDILQNELAGGFQSLHGFEQPLSNGTALTTPWNPIPFLRRDVNCQGGNVQCSGYYCNHCGSCCGNNKCAEDFGNCCTNSISCSFGFNCCNTFSGCCYGNTSFCCSTSSTGCCLLGTTCGANGCVGTASFVISSMFVTTTYTQYSLSTLTTTTSVPTTLIGTSTQFVTSTVTSSASVATYTSYVTSTRMLKREVAEFPIATPTATLPDHQNPEAPAAPIMDGLRAARNGLGELGLLPKRAITSYVVSYDFVWVTTTSSVYLTTTALSTVNSLRTVTSTITSTTFNNAQSTTTITSTIVVTSISGIGGSTGGVTTAPISTLVITAGGGVTSGGGTATAGGGGGVTVIISNGQTVTVGPSSTSSADSGSSGLSVGAQAGIGVGAGVGGLALIGGLVFLLLRLRKNKSNDNITPDNANNLAPPGFNGIAPGGGPQMASWAAPQPPSEMSYNPTAMNPAMMAGGVAAGAAGVAGSYSTHQDVSKPSPTLSPDTPISRNPTASPHTASELSGAISTSPRADAHEMGGSADGMGWHSGPVHEFYEMPAEPYQEHHEMPSPPQPVHHSEHAGQGQGQAQ